MHEEIVNTNERNANLEVFTEPLIPSAHIENI